MPIAVQENPIGFTSITKSNLEGWYDNEIKGKYNSCSWNWIN